ncbi:MAG: hypothetical protein RJA44_1415 [Pseudomonadota bacterium]
MTPLNYFSMLVEQGSDLPLTEACAALGQIEEPRLDLQAVLGQIDRLVARLKVRLPADASPMARLRLLQCYFFDELGFSSEDHERPSAAVTGACHLHEVLRARGGNAVAIAVIYLEMAQQLGLNAQGVFFPGRLLIRISLPLGEVVIDPSDGHSLSREMMMALLKPRLRRPDLLPELALEPFLRPAAPHEIVARLLRQLERRYRQAEHWKHLPAVQQRLRQLLPQEQRHERSPTLARLGREDEAIIELADYLGEASASQPERTQVAARLRLLRAAARMRGD